MTDFKLCREAGLNVLHAYSPSDAYIRAADVEALLAQAPVAYGIKTREGNYCFDSQADRKELPAYDLQCRLIMVTPIVRDTAESLLREMIKNHDRHLSEMEHFGGASPVQDELFERARALLEKGEQK